MREISLDKEDYILLLNKQASWVITNHELKDNCKIYVDKKLVAIVNVIEEHFYLTKTELNYTTFKESHKAVYEESYEEPKSNWDDAHFTKIQEITKVSELETVSLLMLEKK